MKLFSVLPRILFDSWTRKDFTKLQNKNEAAALAKTLLDAADKYRFDGYVLEVWSQIVQVMEFKALITFIQDLGKDSSYLTRSFN